MTSSTPRTSSVFAITVCVFAALAYLGQLYSYFSNLVPASADMLVWPYFMHDWMAGTLDYSLWTLPPSRYIFPDLPAYAFCFIITGGNYLLALLLQFLAYGALFGVACVWVMRRIFNLSGTRAILAGLLVAMLLTCEFIVPRGVVMGLVTPTSHGGATLLVLACWWALSRWRVGQRVDYLLLLFTLAFMGSLGDRIFPLWGVAPLVLILCFDRAASPMRRLSLGAGLLVFGLLGTLVGGLIVPPDNILYAPEGTWRAILKLAGPGGLSQFIKAVTHLPQIYPVFFGLLVGFVLVVAYNFWRHRPLTQRWWSLGWFFLAFAPLVAGLVMKSFYDYDNFRHSPFIAFGAAVTVVGWLFTQALFSRALTLVVWLVMALVAFLTVPLANPWGAVTNPSYIVEIDAIRKAKNLHDGLASYWYCKSVNLLSQEGAFLAPIAKDGQILPVLGSVGEYGLTALGSQPHNFDYIIANILNNQQLIERFGPPDATWDINLPDLNNRWLLHYYKEGRIASVLAQDPVLGALLAQRKGIISNK